MEKIRSKTFHCPESSPVVKMVIDILANHQEGLETKERFLLEYVQLVAKYRLAFISKRDIAFFWLSIQQKAQVGKELGFSEDEIREVASYIRDTYKTEVSLDKLIKQLGEEKE